MRWLLVVPLIALPASAQPSPVEPAAPRIGIETAKNDSEARAATKIGSAAPTPPPEAPAAPVAPEPHPAPESAPAGESVAASVPTVPSRPVVYAPTPAAAVVIRSGLPPSQRKHGRAYYERAAARCEKRATEWARRKCLERVAAE